MLDLPKIEENWTKAAQHDAFHAILTMDIDEEAFWETGRREIEELLDALVERGEVNDKRALDFGCGVGRLTRPLADNFDRAYGVDISPEMIRLAKSYDERPKYILNPYSTLPSNDDWFDLVYSTLVLQHMPSALAHGYIKEFIRVSRQWVVFQIPEGSDSISDHLSMFGTPRGEVERWCWQSGGEVVDVEANDASGPGYKSYRYTVRA